MLTESELDKLRVSSDNGNKIRTFLSGAKTQDFSSFLSTPDMNSKDNSFIDVMNMDTSSMDADALANAVLNGFAYDMPDVSKMANEAKAFTKILGDEDEDSILQKLIKLILGIVKLPMRFGYLSSSMINATAALGVGIGGITQSIALAVKDIYLLIFTILHIIFKYLLCIISFIITTIGGCYFVHIFTLFF